MREAGMQPTAGHDGPPGRESVGFVTDPVCGMQVVPGAAKGGSWTYHGVEYAYRGSRCKVRFQAEPERCLGAATAVSAAGAVAPATTYVCPMDPEVRQDALRLRRAGRQ
jgi:Cu+-exporting ATPase